MVDAEVIEMVIEVLRRAGIDGFKLMIEFGRRSELPACVHCAAEGEAARRCVRNCAAIASAAR